MLKYKYGVVKIIKENKGRQTLSSPPNNLCSVSVWINLHSCKQYKKKKKIMMSVLILFVHYETVSHSNCFRVFTCCCTIPVQTGCNYSKSRRWYIPPLPGFVCWDQSGLGTDWGQTGLSAPPGPNVPADTKTWSLAIAKHPGGTRKEAGLVGRGQGTVVSAALMDNFLRACVMTSQE